VRAEQNFEGHSASVHAAREFVAATLAAWDLDDLSEVACLLSSELAANVVRHVGDHYRLAVEVEPPELLVEVMDSSERTPVLHHSPEDAQSGRGLVIVEALAHRWGTRLLEKGKSVWFTLLLRPASPPLP